MKSFREFLQKGAALGSGLAVVVATSPAFAALDVSGVQTALDSNLSSYETVAVAIIGFVLGVAVIYGILSLIKGRAK